MDCPESLGLLSDLRDGALGEVEQGQVREHLSCCPPCACIYDDLVLIVVTAVELRRYEEISFPDEDVLWQRLSTNGLIIH